MPKFKIGDRVRCIKNVRGWSQILVGKEYDVESYNSYSWPVVFPTDDRSLGVCLDVPAIEVCFEHADSQSQHMQPWSPAITPQLEETPKTALCTCPTLLFGHHNGCSFHKGG